MALKLELEQWQSACLAFDGKDYDSALKTFVSMADNAKMHFNIGLVFAAVDDHERALAAYSRSIAMDPYFAVAYFQRGVSQFCIGNMQEAMQDFDHAHMKLRGNQIINYQQLGLAFRLYACEVLFNRGICRLYLGKIDAGLTDLYHAQKSKMTEEHEVIDQAVRDRGKGYSVFSIPVGVLYRPPESRLRQMPGSVDMFAAVDKLGLNKFQKPVMMAAAAAAGGAGFAATTGLGRNNSVLLSSTKFQRKQSLGLSSLGTKSIPMRYTPSQQPLSSSTSSSSSISSNYNSSPMTEPIPVTSVSSHYPRNHYSPSYPQQNNSNNSIPLSTSSSSSLSSSVSAQQRHYTSSSDYHQQQRTRKNSNPLSNMHTSSSHDDWADNASSSTSSFTSSLRYGGRRVDSGFESSHEDRFSYSSRNSAKSHKTTSRYSPPPVPPIPKSQQQQGYDEEFDPMSYSHFEDHLANDLDNVTINDTDSGRESKIKIKVHYNDTRVLLVPATTTFDELISRVRDKLHAPPHTRLQYKDEDNEMVLMIDDDDLQMARQIHRVRHTQDLGVEKMEIWCIT